MSGYQNDPGTIQQEAGFGFNGRFWTESFTDNVTALAGGAQAGSPVMSSMFNRVSTVATAGDSVQLPPAASIPGGCICVFNNTAKNLTVYGANGSTDTINSTAGSTGVTMVPQSICWFTTLPGINTGWLANGIGYGNYTAGQYPLETLSTQTGITAHAGGTQVAAVQIVAAQAQISVVGTAGDSVRLPPSQAGAQITIVNNGANAANVFPATGEQINSAGANTAYSLAVTTPIVFYCFVAGNWVTK
jgi:hypothetical protein